MEQHTTLFRRRMTMNFPKRESFLTETFSSKGFQIETITRTLEFQTFFSFWLYSGSQNFWLLLLEHRWNS